MGWVIYGLRPVQTFLIWDSVYKRSFSKYPLRKTLIIDLLTYFVLICLPWQLNSSLMLFPESVSIPLDFWTLPGLLERVWPRSPSSEVCGSIWLVTHSQGGVFTSYWNLLRLEKSSFVKDLSHLSISYIQRLLGFWTPSLMKLGLPS